MLPRLSIRQVADLKARNPNIESSHREGEALAELCLRYQVRSLEVFGSAATGKLGYDSDLDFLVVRHADEPILYRNDGGNSNSWLRVETEGKASNRIGLGARITVIPDLDNTAEALYWENDGRSGQEFRLHGYSPFLPSRIVGDDGKG